MPLTKKGAKVKKAMEKTYGKERGERVFYATENKGELPMAKKMMRGGMAGTAGAGLSGRAKGQAISAAAKAGGMGGSRPAMPVQAARPMRKGGKAGKK